MSVERQAITANSLQDGEVVFRAGGIWTPQLADADLFDDTARAEEVLAAAKAEVTRVVDVYLIDVTMTDQAFPVPVPKSYRERIRALGPPVHPDLGKQAQGERGGEFALAAEQIEQRAAVNPLADEHGVGRFKVVEPDELRMRHALDAADFCLEDA